MKFLSSLLPPTFSSSPSLAWRWLCIVGVLAVEICALTLQFDARPLSKSQFLLAVWVGQAPTLLKMGLAATAAFTLLVALDRRTLPDLQRYADRYAWKPWLGAHIAVVGVFTLCSISGFF